MNQELRDLCTLVREVSAEEIMPRFTRISSSEKDDGSLVTNTDLAVQRRLCDALAERYPGVELLGEEMSEAEQLQRLAAADAGLWCIDPLDGTSNYACGFPFFAVSIALLDSQGARLGLVYDPVRDECFAAERARGAWVDEIPIERRNNPAVLKQCIALVDPKRLDQRYLMNLGRGAPYRSQRNLGSVALDWCWIAAGRAQLYLHGGQRLWDYAAGRLILTEAGAASRLLTSEGVLCTAGPDLQPRMAVAAGSEQLLAPWLEWLGLPSATE